MMDGATNQDRTQACRVTKCAVEHWQIGELLRRFIKPTLLKSDD
jgi:hypothetical protein